MARLSEAERLFYEDVRQKASINRRPSKTAKTRPGGNWWAPKMEAFYPMVQVDIKTGAVLLYKWPYEGFERRRKHV